MVSTYAVAGGGILVIMLLLDYAWLGVLARRYYRKTLQQVIAFDVRWLPALAFYGLHTIGLLVFVVLPGGEPTTAGLGALLWRGALFGLFTYGTYDLTNMATVRDWPLHLTVIDILWGMFVTALSAAAGAGLLQWML